MSSSPLCDFDRRSIEELIGEGVEMKYDHSLSQKKPSGLWRYDEYLVCINPTIQEMKGEIFEDIVILHEWLHAYEDIILDSYKDFRETQIEWWAHAHLRRDRYIAKYARSFFPEFRMI